jgi:hypothetical protein
MRSAAIANGWKILNTKKSSLFDSGVKRGSVTGQAILLPIVELQHPRVPMGSKVR